MSILSVVLITLFTVTGNLLLKIGVLKPGISEFWPISLINVHTMLGTASFGLAFIGYATLLQRIPLNVAQAIFSIQFVAVIVSSATILGEPVGVVRWLGIGFILVGILVVTFTAASEI
jgi:drug/metabolite transporter (DMT)-like permease